MSEPGRRTEADDLIDAALRSITEATGPADLRDRVLGRIAARDGRRRLAVAWLPAAAAAAGLAALATAAVLWRQGTPSAAPPPAPPSSAAPLVRATSAPSAPVADDRRPEAGTQAPRRRVLPPATPPGVPLLTIPALEPPHRLAVATVEIAPQAFEPEVIAPVEIRPIGIEGADDMVPR